MLGAEYRNIGPDEMHLVRRGSMQIFAWFNCSSWTPWRHLGVYTTVYIRTKLCSNSRSTLTLTKKMLGWAQPSQVEQGDRTKH